jgi:hypothetical protein
MPERPLNYTTRIAARRTVQECMTILADAGADAVAAQYQDKQPVGLSFRLSTPAGPRDFAMPVNIDGVHKMIKAAYRDGTMRGGRSEAAWTSPEHAANVAWRVMKDWLEAQLALIAAEMATLDEVMLPYLQLGGGQSLYEAYLESGGLRILEAGGG